MHVACYVPDNIPESFRVYIENVERELGALGVTVERFRALSDLAERPDIAWDPRGGAGIPPPEKLRQAPAPLVVTVHGVATMALSAIEYYPTWVERMSSWRENRRRRRGWETWRGQYAAVIAVSHAGRESVLEQLPIDPSTVHVCEHGVDHALFTPNAGPVDDGYLLHISNDEPRKNVPRILAAYRRAVPDRRARLLLKLSGDHHRASGDGVEVVVERLSDEAIAGLYHGALAFVFPSLYEGFGLPVAEAMASGCPVITSSGTACAEVAGDAALLVAPRSVDALAEAMRSVVEDAALRRRMRASGLERAAAFTWRHSAEAHLAVFEGAIGCARRIA